MLKAMNVLVRPFTRAATFSVQRSAPVASYFHTSIIRSQAAPATEPAKWTPESIRTGVIARKRGMTAMWDEEGKRVPVTVLQVIRLQC